MSLYLSLSIRLCLSIRPLFFPLNSLFISLPIYPSICLSVFSSTVLPFNYVCLSIYPYIYFSPSPCPLFFPFKSPSVSLPICPFLSVLPSARLSVGRLSGRWRHCGAWAIPSGACWRRGACRPSSRRRGTGGSHTARDSPDSPSTTA